MLQIILVLLVIAAIASLLGFGRITGVALSGAKILIIVVLVLFLLAIFGIIGLGGAT